MNPSRKSLVFFLAAWLMIVVAGYLCSCNSALGQSGSCGECAFCASYGQIWSQSFFIFYSVSKTDQVIVPQSFNGQACGRTNGALWYLPPLPCSEGGCAGANDVTIGQWFWRSANTCSGSYSEDDIVEAFDGTNPYSPGSLGQMECGYSD